MDFMMFLGFFNILIYLGVFIFGIYIVITILSSMKQRNQYLKGIHEELKKRNEKD